MAARRHAAVLVGLLIGVLGAASPASAKATTKVEPGDSSGGSMVKTGWWWKTSQTPLDDTPAPPPPPPAPNVPAGSLPVAAIGGDPEKVSALEFSLDAAPGSSVTSFTLAIAESKSREANVNHEAAKIVACGVTDAFWADGQAASWKAKPAYDCEKNKAPGARSAAGVWTFDLTAIAAERVSTTGLPSFSVVLVEDVDAPESFQVAYDGAAANGIGFKAVTVAPPKAGTGLPGQGAGASGDGSASDAGSAVGPSSGPVASSGSASVGSPVTGSIGSSPVDSSSGGAVSAPVDVPVADVPNVATGAAGPAVAPVATTQVSPAAAVVPPWYAGVPKAGWLLFPLALGLAYLVMLGLGPDAQPAASTTQRGVGRALEKLRRVSGPALSRGLKR